MSGLQPGNYTISNAAPDPNGSLLYATYVAEDAPLTVNYPNGYPTQTWIVIGNPGTQQQIVPAAATNQQTGIAGNYVEALPAGSYTWYIMNYGDYYIVQDQGKTYYWGIQRAASGESIYSQEGTSVSPTTMQTWQFSPV